MKRRCQPSESPQRLVARTVAEACRRRRALLQSGDKADAAVMAPARFQRNVCGDPERLSPAPPERLRRGSPLHDASDEPVGNHRRRKPVDLEHQLFEFDEPLAQRPVRSKPDDKSYALFCRQLLIDEPLDEFFRSTMAGSSLIIAAHQRDAPAIGTAGCGLCTRAF